MDPAEPADMLKAAIREHSAAKVAPIEGPTSAEIKKAQDDADAQEKYELGRDAMLAKGEGFPADHSAFANYVRTIVRAPRRDNVAALAAIIVKDPLWPGAVSRAQTADYFKSLNARPFLLQTLRALWDEFDQHQRREASKVKRRAARAARKKTRSAQKKR